MPGLLILLGCAITGCRAQSVPKVFEGVWQVSFGSGRYGGRARFATKTTTTGSRPHPHHRGQPGDYGFAERQNYARAHHDTQANHGR